MELQVKTSSIITSNIIGASSMIKSIKVTVKAINDVVNCITMHSASIDKIDNMSFFISSTTTITAIVRFSSIIIKTTTRTTTPR